MADVSKKLSGQYLKICFAVVIVSYIMITLLFSYEDTVSYTVWSVNFWDLLFQGRLGEFYSYSQENLRQAPFGWFCGSYLTTFPWILWSLPLYLTHPLPQKYRVNSMPCILWSKLLLILFIIGIGIIVYKIVKENMKQGEEQAWIATILAVGGYEIIDATAYAGQDEIIYVFFFLVALYYLLRGNKKKYIVWSCLSVTVCPIMLIPFLTAYIIYEKKIVKILIGVMCTLAPSAVFEMAYHNDEIYQSYKGMNTTVVFDCMMNGDLMGTALGNVSLVGIALIILFFVCYVTGQDIMENQGSIFSIYAVAVSFFIICFMAPFNVFYRFGIYAPFWAILVVLYVERMNMNMLLMMIISYGRALCSFGYSPAPSRRGAGPPPGRP